MIARKYLIITVIIIALGLAMAAPASAVPFSYAVSVSSYDAGSSSLLSSSKLALLTDYSTTKIPISSSFSGLSSGKSSAIASIMPGGSTPSTGSVSAFSKFSGIQQQEDGSSSVIEFSQSVSVQGDIYTFGFTSTFF